MCEVKDRLRQVGGLDNAAHLDGAFFFDEFADQVQEFRGKLDAVSMIQSQNSGSPAYLRVPSILPGDQSDQCPQHPSCVVSLFIQLQKPTHSLG